ncbi:nucleoside/nucleotide kinase family protein [Actinacidiphila sp. ITFR-21]|uniref:nucleoside/nucleotide kinase family protein n=1 Tax=Actinacidiphila sp. ITFR-21 TaxID=3075199 RepID=UPI0028890368|nr:nucleoside/nucleotide kinase family protein [Streptomyces sp. ITFR-21]WNI14248.1 nucleoside/nucleotide kinase family protein [Streptomyces sp. ITFR-21]
MNPEPTGGIARARGADPAATAAATTATVSVDDLVAAARALVTPGHRKILGITGAPGSGKSTLGEAIVSALGGQAVLVGLDGFHLATAELDRLGRKARKGAADTFDAAGYVHLLRRLRARRDDTVYTSFFDRSLEESIACAVPVPRDVPLVVTEGNYLLVPDDPWGPVRGLLDECWFLEPGEDVRFDRLITRHMSYGRSAEEAYERSHGSDQRNARLIESTRPHADRVLRVRAVEHLSPPLEENTA